MIAKITIEDKTYDLDSVAAEIVVKAIENLSQLKEAPPEVFLEHAPVVLGMIYKYYNYM